MCKCLICDDDPVYLEIIEHMLTTEGHEVYRSHSYTEALQVIKEQRINVLISDIYMPGTDGFDLIFEVKHNNPFIKIIAITGGRQGQIEDYIQRMSDTGFCQVLKKPIQRSDLKRILN